MPARPKLTLQRIRSLQEDLRRRHHMLVELAAYDLKRLAGKHELSVETVRRFDCAMYGRRVDDRNVWLIARKLKSRSVESATLGQTGTDVPSANAVDTPRSPPAHAQGAHTAREVGVVEDQ